MLRSISDPNYAVGFVDRTEAECLDLHGKFVKRVSRSLELVGLTLIRACVDSLTALYHWLFTRVALPARMKTLLFLCKTMAK